ncbi:hypothetical protein STRCR_1995 [Streptococcus criceti HS-6]|uniref:Uncharacterized protein n=1 Tax=Streptococcus criceti HS-6 TaxID=873449 RepID=G5JRI7_STRCG|nr:hypothetical protein STRCR_1995 [Streptococcus criceti HS-6]
MNHAGARLVGYANLVLLPTTVPRVYSQTGVLDKFWTSLIGLFLILRL